MRRVATTHMAICKTLLERGCLSSYCCCCSFCYWCCCCCLLLMLLLLFVLCFAYETSLWYSENRRRRRRRLRPCLTAGSSIRRWRWRQRRQPTQRQSPNSSHYSVLRLPFSLSLSLSHFACRSAHAELFDAFLIALLPRWALFDLIKSMRHLIKTHADRQDKTETV